LCPTRNRGQGASAQNAALGCGARRRPLVSLVYEGLFDTRKGLSEHDRAQIGVMMARLLLPWSRWVHRRVERVAFCDEDAARREIGIDFTLPHWYHELRQTPQLEARRQLVPLAFLRKGVLINFRLRNEEDTSLPLLTSAQNTQVTEALLCTLAQIVLGDDVPSEIRCDIRSLVSEQPEIARSSYERLLTYDDDPASSARAKLRKDETFTAIAEAFIRSFLALTMLEIRRHERRIVHLSYEDSLWQDRSRSTRNRLRRLQTLAYGSPRTILFMCPAVGDTSSYHFEVESPDGLQVSAREEYVRIPSGITPTRTAKGGGFNRAHIHFADADPGSQAVVLTQLLPRRSTIIRSAVVACSLVLVALAVITLRIGNIQHGTQGATTAAALLLSTIGLLGLFLVRSGESPMSTTLLVPIRVLAISPIVWSFAAAVVIVGGFSESLTRWLLLATCALTLVSGARLIQTWRRVVLAASQ
jgi:hypothetical protein